MKTRTGGFEIGVLRRIRGWQEDLAALVRWARENDLQVVDVQKGGAPSVKTVVDAGLTPGSAHLAVWEEMISPDKGKRQEAVARNADYVRACAAYGPMNHLLVMLPEDPSLPRRENFGYMVESFNELAPVLEENDAKLVVEGWPGPGALCCTPEGYRAFFEQCPSPAMGVNYDPSHLIRMDIDHLRFLDEFGDRVFHVHGKDAQILTESLYEFGREQPATFAKPIPYGAHIWRYTIPGHGVANWLEVMRKLEAAGFSGSVCIELEDANYLGSPEDEKLGILQGARFLTGC